MIVENEGYTITNWSEDNSSEETPIHVHQGCNQGFQQYLQRNTEIRDREVHYHLRSDLVEHVWTHFRGDEDGN